MKRRGLRAALLAVFLGLLGVAGVMWCLARHEILPTRHDGASAKPSHEGPKPEVPKQPALGEVVPLLKRQTWGSEENEAIYHGLPSVDLDKFGDVTEDLYFVPFKRLMHFVRAEEGAKSQREKDEFANEYRREADEYIRRNWPEAYQHVKEKADGTAPLSEREKKSHLSSFVMAARCLRATVANFHLSGVVVNDQGCPCSDVSVEIDETAIVTNQRGWPEETSFSGSIEVSGPFAFRLDEARFLRLSFHKQGYYSVRNMLFSAPEPAGMARWEIGLTGKQFPPEVIERRNLRIVMEKQGELTRLRSGGGTLTFRRDGTGDVLTMGVNADGHWFMRTTSGQDMSIAPPRGLPEKCVYVVPKTNNEGSITLVRFSALESRRASEVSSGTKAEVAVLRVPDDESQYVYAPAELRLVISDPQGGFVRYKPKPDREIRPDRPWSRDMKEAPEEGYLDELVLDSDVMKKLFANPDEPQPVYFYIKAFGKYGKGRLDLKIMLKEAHRKYVNGQLEPIRYLLDEAALAAQVHILMQPDGSRNLKGYE